MRAKVFSRVCGPRSPDDLRTGPVRRAERLVAGHGRRSNLLDVWGRSRMWWLGWAAGLALAVLAEPPSQGAGVIEHVRTFAFARVELLASMAPPPALSLDGDRGKGRG